MTLLPIARFLVPALAFPMMAMAQRPPARPAPAPRPAPVVTPAPEPIEVLIPPMAIEPMIPMEPMLPLEMDFHFSLPELHLELPDVELHMPEMEFQYAEIAEHAQEAAAIAVEHLGHDFEWVSETAEIAVHDAMTALQRGNGDKLLESRPRAPWAAEDPADSLYRLARESLNRGEYRRAAQLFNELTRRFPRSTYAESSKYWEAFARYRAGTTDDLREAIKILEAGSAQLASLRGDGNVDVPALRARIQAALAARGDAEAAKQLEREAAQNNGCDREEVSVRAEALSALGQMDFAAALPAVKRVLARRDECTVELRRRALYILGRNPSTETVPLMLEVAKNDPESSIRGDAMSWLSRVGGDQAIPMLEEMLRTATDERTQRQAVFALGSIDTDNSRRAVRAIIDRADAADRVRCEAMSSLTREREGRVISADDQTYLRSLYARLPNARLRECALAAVSRIGGAENEQFLLGIARNQNEQASLRAAALQRLGRMEALSVNDIAGLYALADSRSMREAILNALYHRKEPEAVDKMMDIARKDTDPRIRRYAISLLLRRNDPRATALLQEMIENERP